MIDGGIILFLIAAFIAVAALPAERALARRAQHHEISARPVVAAFRIPPPAPSLDALAAQAEAALDADDLTRGVRDVSQVYRRAARHRQA